MSELFSSLAILACPVTMGLMMWFMVRGTDAAPPAASAQDAELARMRAEIDQLRASEHNAAAKD